MTVVILIAIIIAIVIIVKLNKKRKKVQLGALTLITGGVKNGKSTLAVHLAIKNYKKALRKYKFAKFICKLPILSRYMPKEEPLLYSNIPLAGVKYAPITKEILLREKRVNYKSIIYIQEASLVADSQLGKATKISEMDINDRLLLFNKLIGHETKGGKLIYDTQNLVDCHYTIKRSMSHYLWLYPMKKIPFFCIIKCRELIHDEAGDVQNVFNEDIEESMKTILVPKRVWKKFDAYCYSSLTDDKPVQNATKFIPIRRTNRKRLKVNPTEFVSFNKRIEKKVKDND